MPLTVWITTNWKILKGIVIPDHLIFLLRKLYAGQEATELHIEQLKGVQQGCTLPSCLFNLYADFIMWNARLDESQIKIKTAERNTNKLR